MNSFWAATFLVLSIFSWCSNANTLAAKLAATNGTGVNSEAKPRADDMELISLEDWQADQKENREASSAKEKWILIHHRLGKGKGPFEENGWEGYKKGFGSEENDDYWIGLEKLHELTSTGRWDVKFMLSWTEKGAATFICHNFYVGSEQDFYRLGIGSCGDLIGDQWYEAKMFGIPKFKWWSDLNNGYFSTRDRDNDADEYSCAVFYNGGFWYKKNVWNNCILGFRPPTGNWWNEGKMAIRQA